MAADELAAGLVDEDQHSEAEERSEDSSGSSGSSFSSGIEGNLFSIVNPLKIDWPYAGVSGRFSLDS